MLEKAVLPRASGGCAAVWRAYLRLEASRRREGASRLQLRAVQQCPGFKSLWCAAPSSREN